MAEAVVNLKLAPGEFDLLRRALKTHQEWHIDLGKTEVESVEVRRAAKTEAMRTGDLMDKLGTLA